MIGGGLSLAGIAGWQSARFWLRRVSVSNRAISDKRKAVAGFAVS